MVLIDLQATIVTTIQRGSEIDQLNQTVPDVLLDYHGGGSEQQQYRVVLLLVYTSPKQNTCWL